MWWEATAHTYFCHPISSPPWSLQGIPHIHISLTSESAQGLSVERSVILPSPPGYYGNTDFCADTSQIDGHNAITFIPMTGIQPVSPAVRKTSRPDSPHQQQPLCHMLRTHGHIPLTHVSRALIWLQDRIEGFSELFPTLSRSVRAAVMLQLSGDPGIKAVFQQKLRSCGTRRGVFPAWCMWSTHVQSRVYSRPDPRGGWNLARGRRRRQEPIKDKSSALRRLPCICATSPPSSAEGCEGRGDSHRCYWFQTTPLFNTPRPLYDATVTPPPPPNGCTWLSFASSCTCSASFQNVSFKLLRFMFNMIYSS